MYIGNKINRITIRLNQRQYDYLKGTADTYGISPSQFLRLVIDQVYYKNKKGVDLIENIETNNNDKF